MSNKQLLVGKLKDKTGEEFYPKTVWEAILNAPDIASGIGKVFTVTNNSLINKYELTWNPLKTINGQSLFGNGNIEVITQESVTDVVVNGVSVVTDTIASIPSIPVNISDLRDIEISNLLNNQILKYNSVTGKWVNSEASGGAGVLFVNFTIEGHVYSCDTSIDDIVSAAESGKMVCGACQLDENIIFNLYYYSHTEEAKRIIFVSGIQNASFLFIGYSEYTEEQWSEDDWGYYELNLSLSDLDDTAISSPTQGQVLTYNGYRWENANPTGEDNVQSDWNQSDNTADDFIKNKPTIPTVPTDVSAFNNDAGYATETYVNTAIGNLPEPMIFKGSLGTGGTITTLPAASSLNEGYVYKVITNGTYASQAAKIGDTFISTGSAWVLIPSGDEPSGTVTSVGIRTDPDSGIYVVGSPITSSGTIDIKIDTDLRIPKIKDQDAWDAKQDAIDNDNKLNADYIVDGSVNKVINVKPDWNAASGADAEILNKPAIHNIPAGGNAGQVLKKTSATDYDADWANASETLPSVYCTTSGSTAAKKANCSLYVAQTNQYLQVLIGSANTYQGALTLNINSAGAKPIYINGTASSSSNYTLPNGTYFVFYDGTNYYFRTDGKLPMKDTAFGGSYNDLADKPATIPAPTSLDEGKLLSVNASGNYELVTILNSENIPY